MRFDCNFASWISCRKKTLVCSLSVCVCVCVCLWMDIKNVEMRYAYFAKRIIHMKRLKTVAEQDVERRQVKKVFKHHLHVPRGL